MKQFVTALDKKLAAFKYLQDFFSKLSEAKVKAIVFIGPQIKKILECKEFPKKLTRKEKAVWNSFVLVVRGFLGNHKAENDVELFKTLVKNYGTMGCRMSLKVNILDAHLDKFKENMGILRGARQALPPGYNGRVCHYQGQYNKNMMGNYIWGVLCEMCQIMSKGVVAVLGPSASPASNSIISNICGEKEVPYVKVAPEDILKVQFPRFTTLDLRPTNTDISLAVAGLLTFLNSTTSCLICAEANCLLNLEVLLRQFLISKETLSVRMLDDSQDPTPLLKEIRDDKTATIIVDANATMSHSILERASELGMLSVYYTYIFTSLVRVFDLLLFPAELMVCSSAVAKMPFMEFSLLRLDDVADQRVNIIGFSVFNRTHPFFQDFLLSLNRSWQENCDHAPFAGTPLSSALLFDAVHTVVAAVQELNRSQNVGATQLSCKSSKIWEHGTSLMNYLRMVELEGLTGHIEFNSRGQRSNYALRIMQNSRDGLRQHVSNRSAGYEDCLTCRDSGALPQAVSDFAI
ncbi:glutamate receptor ionotropic, kainate 4 [Ictalurus punctatus]|uniref:Glutamate receptor ionotropic, kainate 4 n=1 Tax=Ictalurus punctatus TaxID=7998 RepID=A0A9F7RT69_ICTPU|nr:glutamate receptor ionotropic, kainate 4 [Ictalurus punctatus]